MGCICSLVSCLDSSVSLLCPFFMFFVLLWLNVFICFIDFLKIHITLSLPVQFFSPGDTLSQAVDLVPLLIQTVEKSAAQSSQHALLTEGVAASVLLCRLSMLDSVPGEGLVVQCLFRQFMFCPISCCIVKSFRVAQM